MTRRRHRLVLRLAPLAAATVLAGCGAQDDAAPRDRGAADPASLRASFKAQRTTLDAIGSDIGTALQQAPGQRDAEVRATFEELADRARAAHAGLDTLDVPARLRARLDRLRAAVADGTRDLRAIAAAAAAGDAEAAAAATRRLGADGTAIAAASSALARALGVPATTTAAPGGGRITVSYAPPATRTAAVARTILQLGGTDGVAAGFSKRFVLPQDIRIAVVDGTVAPHYDPRTRTVTLSYGLVDQIARLLRRGRPGISDDEFGRELASINGFILVHELGHAFVDLFELPITGREEDAVDGLATVFLVDAVQGGDEYAFNAARFFKMLSGVRRVDASSFYDEHSLDAQRAYDIVCTIAGSSTERLAHVRRLGILPDRRLQRCPGEYRQKTRAWRSLLAPHLR